MDRQLRGTARVCAYYLLRRTGALLPGYGRVDVRALARRLKVGPRQLYRIRTRIAPFVNTRQVGSELVVWSLMGARARTSQARWAEWWREYKSLAVLAPHSPFLREVRAWLEEAEAAHESLFSEQYRVSAGDDVRVPPESGAFPVTRPRNAVTPPPIPEGYRVSADASHVSPLADEPVEASSGISRGFWGAEALTKMSALVTRISEQFRVFASQVDGSKQGREIQDRNVVISAAPASSEIEPPPPSGSARGGVERVEGTEESPVPPPGDTWTADHGPDEGAVAPPPSETRLKAAKEESPVTREEQLAALAALEAGEAELPETPGAPLKRRTEPPMTPLAELAPEALARPQGPAKAKPERATFRAFAVAVQEAMRAVRPAWRSVASDDNRQALVAVFEDHCRHRTHAAMLRWVEANVTRFAKDERADGHALRNLPKFLAATKAREPEVPLPEIRGHALGSGAPPPAELFELLGLEAPKRKAI